MTLTPLSKARVWMGKLPREDFEKLLLLTREAHRRGAREAIAKIHSRAQTLSQQELPITGLVPYVEKLMEEYPR